MSEILFSGRPFDALIFDMDGTILTSVGSAERVWGSWALRHGIDPKTFVPTIHGVRAAETIVRQGLPNVDIAKEVELVTAAEMADMDGVAPVTGAAAFLASLPADRWAIATSASRDLALRRLEAAGLTPPRTFITAEDVEHGKPSPDCFLLAAAQLGFAAGDCVVFEDAPAGIEAAKAAGAAVVVIRGKTYHSDGSQVVIDDYRSIGLEVDASGRMVLSAVQSAAR